MTRFKRYLVTVDAATGAAVKMERMGEGGDLTEVPLSTLTAVPTAPAGGPQTVVINVYAGAAPPGAAPPGTVPTATAQATAETGSEVGWSYQIHQPVPLWSEPQESEPQLADEGGEEPED